MDFPTLRTSEAKDLAKYLRDAASHSTTKGITNTLLKGIDSGALPPRVFGIWLTASNDPDVVNDGVRQDFSRYVRLAAISHCKRWLRTSRAELAWTALGGTAGILEFLNGASVNDVKCFCRSIYKTGSSTYAREQRQRYVEELFKALDSQLCPDSEVKTNDQRPLAQYHHKLLGACCPDFALTFWSQHWTRLDRDASIYVFSALPSAARLQCLDVIAKEPESPKAKDNLRRLLQLDIGGRSSTFDNSVPSHLLFLMDVLRKICQDADLIGLDHGIIHSTVIGPLFQRLRRRKSDAETVGEAVRLFVDYRWHLVSKGKDLASLPEKYVLYTIVHRWARYPDALQVSLERILNTAPFSHQPNEKTAEDLLRLVSMQRRYEFLRLLMKRTNTAADIDIDEDLTHIPFRWSPGLLLLLPRQKARQLLERLIQLKPNDTYGNWRPNGHELSKQHDGDPTCLLLLLSRGDDDGLRMASTAVEEIKEKAYKARQQELRAALVQRTLDCAVASGSLDFYRDALIWTRRYIKDPLTSMKIYAARSLCTDEGIELLCGFSSAWGDLGSSTAEQVCRDVHKANRICEDLVETARMALNDPGFQAYHWKDAMTLLDEVVQKRINSLHRLQKKTGLDESSLFDIVWQPTIDTVFKLESIGLLESSSELGLDDPEGILSSLCRLPHMSESTLKFLDTLARLRNGMWVEHRQKRHPETMTLPENFPRGLAIQHLNSCDFKDEFDFYDLPFLRERAKQIVFIDSHHALLPLSKFEDVKDSVDVFMDNWATAARAYLYTHPKSERYERAVEVWKHATGPLSRPRMSSLEAAQFWQHVWQNNSPFQEMKGPWNTRNLFEQAPEPRLPEMEDEDQPIEWHPDPEGRRTGLKTRALEVTVLDAMLAQHGLNMEERLSKTASVYETVSTNLWQRHVKRYSKMSIKPATQEALIAASLLCVSEKTKCPGILSKPFPSTVHPRFPALYLDEEFLEQPDVKNSVYQAISALEWLSDQTPPQLLLELTRKVLGADNSDRRALALLRILTRCDRPQFALDIIQETILDQPQNSSWHRSLLRKGFLGFLPQATVKSFLESLSRSMIVKVQHSRSDGDGDGEGAPAVKVTTVKMLAQLLVDAMFVDLTTTAQILAEIFEGSRHIDIRVAVVEGLLHILATTEKDDLKVRVLDMLEQKVVPIMASLDERRPLTEDEWREFERTDFAEMPEVYMERSPRELPPLLSAVCAAAMDEKKHREWVRRVLATKVLYPTLEESIRNNQRWLKGFFKHLGTSPIEFPACPVKPVLLSELLGNNGYCTKEVLDQYLRVFAANCEPSPQLEALNKVISGDAKLQSSNAGQHWLSLWRKGPGNLWHNDKATPARLLQRKPHHDPHFPTVEYNHIQSVVLQQAHILLRTIKTPNYTSWTRFIGDLKPCDLATRPSETWAEHCRPVLERIIDEIDTLRSSKAWRENPHRKPAVLPDPLPQRVWLTFHGPPGEGGQSSSSSLAPIATRLSLLLQHLTSSSPERPTRLYHDSYRHLLQYTQTLRFRPEDLMLLALALHSKVTTTTTTTTTTPESTADFMHFDLAFRMLTWSASGSGSPPPAGGPRRVATLEMIRTWARSRDEDVRMLGLGLLYPPVVGGAGVHGKKPWYSGGE